MTTDYDRRRCNITNVNGCVEGDGCGRRILASTMGRSGATKFDFPRYSNLVAGFISKIRRFDIPPRKFDFVWLNIENVRGAIFLPAD